MNAQADCHIVNGAAYLKALNVQNALGYKVANTPAGWREYDRALGKRTRAERFGMVNTAASYTSAQCLLALLGELA